MHDPNALTIAGVPLTSTMHNSRPDSPHGTDFVTEVLPSMWCVVISSEKVWHAVEGRGKAEGSVFE